VKGASQIAIRCGYYIDQPLDYDKDLCKLSFANYIFGGFFNSRLNTDLREQKGYTYRAFSYLTGNPAYSSFSIELAVPSADLAGALPEIIRQVDSFSRAGLSQTEIAFLKKAFSFSNPLLKEFYYDKMKFLQLLADDEIPENVDQQQHRLMNRLTGEELNAVISRLIDPSRFRIILVGDQSDIEQGLTRLTAGTADGSIALGNYRFHVYAK
jgi:zinc protease